ncbi:hypothetical protein [Stenotrophomonas oahuensis]|uniref:Conjugal transfer protein TrbC n=1 Tax=Stenotrophomonas oahuensis TaxID=3003271 RepID=A0ABY9YW94_9GAMM|nr:hypothetical protein [Stenotrophomonas sp. A5586]WNH54856.1 hypothetical protein PDM29_20800 [Stenotrophomonas sp. A5586]
MSTTVKTYISYAIASAVVALFLFYPDLAHADGGSVVRGKIDGARSSYAIPIAGGIITFGAVTSVVLWLLDIVDWKNMAKWILGAILLGAIAGIAAEVMS